jgi:S1-C subfamily serine protease
MAENEDLTQPLPASRPSADEPTQALPPSGGAPEPTLPLAQPGAPEPTLPLPTSAWARPADLGASGSPNAVAATSPLFSDPGPAATQPPRVYGPPAAAGQPGGHVAGTGHYAQAGDGRQHPQPGPYPNVTTPSGHPAGTPVGPYPVGPYPSGQYPSGQYPNGTPSGYPGVQYPHGGQPGPYAAQAQPAQPGENAQSAPGQYGPGAPTQWYGQAYGPHQGYPPPGYYPAQHYYAQPPAKQRTRWPLALVAMLVALVLGGSGFLWASNALTGAFPDTGQTTLPQPDQSQGGQTNPNPSSRGSQGGSTTGSAVSAAQSAGVVLIDAETTSGAAAGTGMVLSADGKVLTNYHVVAGSQKVSATIADSGNTYVATVLGFDQSRDVALLQLKNASGLTTVRTDTVVPPAGTAVAAVGNAEGGGELVKASGQVTALDQSLTVSSDSPWGSSEDLSGLIRTNARAVPGDSGGPMFDSDNEVVGMTTAGSTRDRSSYAVPIATALAVVQQVEAGQDAGTVRVGPAGYLGIKVADADQTGTGKTITAVVSGSPADKAGVTAGSRLIAVNGTTIKSSTNLATVIRALEPGQQVVIEWTAPNGAQRQATVTLGSSPVN